MRLWWLLLLSVAGAGAQVPRLDADGACRLDGGDLPDVEASLFCWYGDWRYAVPRDVARGADGVVTGSIAAGEGEARVDFRLVPREVEGRLELACTFRRTADTALTRGLFLLIQMPLEPVRGRAVRFSHAPSAPVESGFRGAGRGCGVNLDEQQALTLRGDRILTFERRGDAPDRLAINVRLLPAEFAAGEDTTVVLNLGLAPAEPDWMPWELAMREPLAIRSASPLEPSVPVNTPATIEIDLAATYDNPFDPDDVAVDAEVEPPGGPVYTLPGYFHQEYRAAWEDGVELLEPVGEPGWRVRFTPRVVGIHHIFVRARDRTGDVGATRIRVDATAGAAPGFITIGPNGRHFARSTGEGLFLIGHNVPTYLASGQSMADALDRMAAGGENYTRPWMYSAQLGLEWDQPVGTYRLQEAWRLDNLFRLAASRGINLMLCFDTHQDFQERIVQNPYHVDRGGPIRTSLEFFTNQRARELYQRRLRYIVARWSHATNLVAWEFVNEIEGWRGFADNQPAVADWHSAMAAHLKLLDPYDHPVTTSCWKTPGHPTLWNAPGLDFIQAHHYANARVDMAQRTTDITRRLAADYPGRLLLFGEMGVHYQFGPGRGDAEDPAGRHLHEQSWAALMEGAASVPVNWWHESYIHPNDLYGVFAGLRGFVDTIDFTRPWRPLGEVRAEWVAEPRPLSYRDVEFSGAADPWQPPRRELVVSVDQDGNVIGADSLPTLMQGRGHADLRRPVVFELDLPADGKLLVHIGRCSNNPRLLAFVDDGPVLDRPLPTGEGHGRSWTYREQWNLWESVYDEAVAVPIPAGRHRVRLENDGGDWMEVPRYTLTGYASNRLPPAGVQALGDGRDLLVWVRNRAAWWWPLAQGQPVEPLSPLRLILPEARGRFRVERWDTRAGRVESSQDLTLDGVLADSGPIDVDAAFRLTRLEP